MATKKWMSKAFANSHGQFKAQAKRHGMSTAEYARKVTKAGSKASTHVKRQANLALRGMQAAIGHRKKK